MQQHTLRAALFGASLLAACGGGGGTASVATLPPVVVVPTPPVVAVGPAWTSYGGDAQHRSQAGVATQALNRILWQAPVDLAPVYSNGGALLTHYGSPVITAQNTVILPVKTGATAGFRFEGRSGSSGAVLWSAASDYVMPAHRWIPSYNVTLTAANRVYAAGAGGKVYYRDNADSATATTQTSAFFGDAVYSANQASLDTQVFINTPITADGSGNIYFGFTAASANSAGLASGIARIGADGKGSWASASTLTLGAATKVAMNSAPAVSADGKMLYVVVNNDQAQGYILGLDSTTLALGSRTRLIDPSRGTPAGVSDDSTASPVVGPDGDVYIGVLETAFGEHNGRGWLLHFDRTLNQEKLPGSFGWDDTPSVVPATMVPSYKGSATYLLMTKYNNYARGLGDGQNKLAVLDPNAAQGDPYSSVQVMKEVLTVLGPTPDPGYYGGVTEWCINVAAVDPFTKSILANSEDGYLYRWDLTSNTLSQRIKLTSGLGESYTPTLVGPDGVVYAINNAILFAVGK
ncbi:MAG: hypothetical protein V4463_15475 [Pseudomonadota bacterium]